MKKLIAITVCFVMAFTLVACGDKHDEIKGKIEEALPEGLLGTDGFIIVAKHDEAYNLFFTIRDKSLYADFGDICKTVVDVTKGLAEGEGHPIGSVDVSLTSAAGEGVESILSWRSGDLVSGTLITESAVHTNVSVDEIIMYIADDLGKGSPAASQLDFLEIATYAQLEVEKQTGETVKISVREDDWVINVSDEGLYYAAKSTMDIDGVPMEVVCHIQFDDSSYESWVVKWLNIDGKDFIDNR